MLVYGDVARSEEATALLQRVASMVEQAASLPASLMRHDMLVAALIEAGALAQGVADACFAAAGHRDVVTEEASAAMALVQALARCCAASWDGGFASMQALPWREMEACARLLTAGRIALTLPEGYAFYALYPVCCLQGARRLAARLPRVGKWQVFGIRSIGTSLAAMAAVGLGAWAVVTVRPTGHPFERQVACDPACIDRSAQAWAIVDEGPGLSGSSFAAVARWLTSHGVPQERLHFLPSHAGGPGAQASCSTRQLWRGIDAQVATFDDVVLHAHRPAHRLGCWVETVTGPLTEPLQEITGGAWRDLHDSRGPERPPAHPWQERRKFIARTAHESWLLKFAGLGVYGHENFSRARSLAQAGFAPEAVALCHGFIIQPWHGEMQPHDPVQHTGRRDRWIDHLARYLAFRSRAFCAPTASGASLHALHAAGKFNTQEAFGMRLAERWDTSLAQAERLSPRVRRCETDNRLHAWEWLVAGDRILKTDALDHHASHDLVGAQDIAWDIAGAIVEFDLLPDEQRALQTAMAQYEAVGGDAELVRFLEPCYLAFQMGSYVEAAAAAALDREAALLRRRADLYRTKLACVLRLDGSG